VNWGLFSFTALISIIAGIVSRRGGLTTAEAWTIVLTRVGMATIFSLLIPEQLNSGVLILIAGREITQFFEHVIAYTADSAGTKLEARKWLNP
jgi:hypothetical protein